MKTQASISRIQLAVLCSLSTGCTMLPYLIISSMLSGESQGVNFFVPVIIVYTVVRSCLVALRGFGEIANPFRILKGGLLIALPGALLMLLSYLCRPLLMPGALLVGIGFSPIAAMFAPIYSDLVMHDPSLKKSKGIGTIIYLVLVLMAMTVGKGRIPIVAAIFLLYIICALRILLSFDGDAMYAGRKAFVPGTRNYIYFVFGALVLLCLLVLRQYKQSGISFLIWLAPAAVAVSTVLEIIRRPNYRDFVYQTYWTGAMKNHLLVFSLLYHASVGNSSMAVLTYVAIAVGDVLSPIIRKPLQKIIPARYFTGACMFLTIAFSLLLAVSSAAANFIGILAAEALCGLVSVDAAAGYMKDNRHMPLERPLTRLRVQTVGSVWEQMMVFITVYLLGKYSVHSNLLSAYATGVLNPDAGRLMRIASLICSLLMLIAAFLITAFAKKDGHDVENEQDETAIGGQ